MEEMIYDKWKKRVVRFLTAQTVSLLGSSIVQFSIIYYITLTTSSGVAMSISTICGYVPQMIIALFAGTWLDKYDRKKLMMLSDAIIALATLMIAIAFLAGYKNILFLYLVLIVRSAGTGVQTPAVNSFIPQLVPKNYLMKVNGINSTISSLITFLSPAISGIILSSTSVEFTFFIDVITAIIGISIMFTIKVRSNVTEEISRKDLSPIQGLKEGFRYINNNKLIKNQIIYIMIVSILVAPSAFLTPLLVVRSFGDEVYRVTFTQMGFGIGAMVGGVIISTWGGFKNKIHTIISSTILYGAMMFCMGLSKYYIIFLIFNTIIGICLPLYNTPVNVLLQENSRSDMLGRVFSILQIVNACAFPFGIVVFGPLADIISIQSILIVNGILIVIHAIRSYLKISYAKV